MTEPITWRNETRRLHELVPYQDNPRSIDDEQGKRLVRSREKFAQPWPIVIGPDGELFDGHQRLDKWGEKWGLDLEVAVRVASRALSEAERKELVVLAHDGAVGEFDVMSLLDWGVETEELEEWGLSDELLAGLLEAAEDEPPPNEPKYTGKIESPIYEPKNEKPSLVDLYDIEKAEAFIVEIEGSDIPDDEKAFLVRAAQRHVVFDYSRIADYYAHSDAIVQNLMEKSALVIIDFNKAIENGYVNLSKKIIDLYLDESSNG